jgi:hypothetical protein
MFNTLTFNTREELEEHLYSQNNFGTPPYARIDMALSYYSGYCAAKNWDEDSSFKQKMYKLCNP